MNSRSVEDLLPFGRYTSAYDGHLVSVLKVSEELVEGRGGDNTHITLMATRVGHERHTHLGDDPKVGLREDATGSISSAPICPHPPLSHTINLLRIRPKSIREDLPSIAPWQSPHPSPDDLPRRQHNLHPGMGSPMVAIGSIPNSSVDRVPDNRTAT